MTIDNAQHDEVPSSRTTLRVAHCLHTLDLGGAQRVVASIVRGSQRHAVRPFVYAAIDGVFRRELEDAGAQVRILRRHLPKFDPFWAIALAHAMRADGIDVVHTHLFGDTLHGYLAARIAGKRPVVMTLHIGTEGLTSLQRGGYRWLLRRSSRTIACTESASRSFAALVGDAVRIETIANGIAIPPGTDVARIAPLRTALGIPENTPVIGAIGRLAEQKGFADLIDAVAHLGVTERRSPWLVVVGAGPLLATLRDRARAAGIGERVVFAGYRSDIADLLAVFDVVVFSSLYEGLSIALLEAMACACCIVATDAPGITDAVSDDREALVVPRRDPVRLSAALHRVLGDSGMRARLGVAAQRRFRRAFTVDEMVGRYFRVYDDLRRQACDQRAPEARPAAEPA